MRVLFALTIITAFALPISAQAGHGGGGSGGGGGGRSTNKGAPTGAGTTKDAISAHPSTTSGAGARKGTSVGGLSSAVSGAGASKGTGSGGSAPKPAARDDKFLTLDGIQGESKGDSHGGSIEIESLGPSSSPSPPSQPHPAPPPK